mmetsp:Transcript_20918/g.50164  ORF Transcript_20918/g.50164 Transcript_20918/m.50164 type:complete len:226 (-) Transcript_20918:365-1042(-)
MGRGRQAALAPRLQRRARVPGARRWEPHAEDVEAEGSCAQARFGCGRRRSAAGGRDERGHPRRRAAASRRRGGRGGRRRGVRHAAAAPTCHGRQVRLACGAWGQSRGDRLRERGGAAPRRLLRRADKARRALGLEQQSWAHVRRAALAGALRDGELGLPCGRRGECFSPGLRKVRRRLQLELGCAPAGRAEFGHRSCRAHSSSIVPTRARSTGRGGRGSRGGCCN